MTFLEFSEKWISVNIPSSLYGNSIANYVTQFCDLLIKQHHSGSTWTITLQLFYKLVKDYEKHSA